MSGKGAKGLAGGKGAKVKGAGDKKKPVSRSVKAGLQFPVGRIHRFLKARPHFCAPAIRSWLRAPVSYCNRSHFFGPAPRAQERSTANGRVGATAAVYSAAILGKQPDQPVALEV